MYVPLSQCQGWILWGQCLTLTVLSLYRDSLLLEAGFLTILVAPLNLFFWRKYVCVSAQHLVSVIQYLQFIVNSDYPMVFIYPTIFLIPVRYLCVVLPLCFTGRRANDSLLYTVWVFMLYKKSLQTTWQDIALQCPPCNTSQ